MRRFAFAVAILGLFILSVFLEAKPVVFDDVNNLVVNERVFLEGKVLKEKELYGETKIIFLDKNLSAICDCREKLINKNVEIIGKVEQYQRDKQIRVLRILSYD